MATNFPGSVDDASTVGDNTHPSADELLSSTDGGPAHHALHQNVGLAINAIEDKVGTGASTPVVGSVLTGTGSGTSEWSNTPLYVDTTNNRVGIGTTSPETTLDIVTANKLGTSFTGTTDGEGVRVAQSSYTSGEYVSLIEGASSDTATAPHARIGVLYDGSGSHLAFGTSNSYASGITNTAMFIDQSGKVGIGTTSPSTKLDVNGSLSKNSGSFKIPHPLPEMTETHHLVHSFVEAPQADNLYRGRVALVDGAATVDLDKAAGMTTGTFELLNRELQCFVVNNESWTAVRGSVSGATLTIEAQDATCTDTVDWLVIGERHDQHMYDTEWTDDDGRVIVEPEKPQVTEAEAVEPETA